MENDLLNFGEYFNCYNETPIGYYLDINNSLYKKCYDTCETCDIKGDNEFHNCLKCNSEFKYQLNINNYINCYKNCSYYYYFANDNYHCTNNLSCPSEYPQLIQNRNECISVDIKYIENLIDDLLKFEINETNRENKKEEEINVYNKILNEIESIFTSENYNLYNIDKGEDQFINAEKLTITLTNIENQKNNIDSNMSTIDLGDCEDLLRIHYNLTDNQTIYMKKIDIIQDGMKAKKIEYNVYSKLSGNNLVKLNLSVCENSKISINIPYEINGNIDKYNTSSGYFNDICYTSTSNDGTDISLNDRKNEYIDGDNIICQEDCDFATYNSTTKKAKCECKAKDSNSSFADMIIDKNKLFENLKDIKNLINFNILICYKKLSSFNFIIYNVGCIIIAIIIIFHIIVIIIFYISQLKKINKRIKHLMFGIQNMSLIKGYLIKNNKKKLRKKIRKNERIKNYIKRENTKNLKSDNKIFLINNNYNINITTNFIPDNSINNNKNVPALKDNEKKRIKKLKKLMAYNTDEINDLSYNLALNYDKRTFCQYYNSLLKVKHFLFFSFCDNNDYNSRIIKVDLFFIGITIDYTVNALFFNDDTMHKIYVSKGKYDLETQIPITIYSFLISMVLNIPLSILGLSNDSIINFKQNLISKDVKKRGKKLIFCLKLKFTFYFIISFILLLFFWYYITIFGVIYKNTQYHLLKDTLISFGISMIYPFLVYLLPGIFRIFSLSNPKKKRECLYNFSKLILFF